MITEHGPGDEHQARQTTERERLPSMERFERLRHYLAGMRAKYDGKYLNVYEIGMIVEAFDRQEEERSLDAFQRRVGEWGNATFPRSTYASKWAHLDREVEELSEAIDIGAPEAIAEEAADCLMLLLHIMHQADQSLWDAAQRKFTELQLRRWGQPDAQGVVEHVRE